MKSLLEYFNQLTSEKEQLMPLPKILIPEEYSGNLPLIIKRYNFPDCFSGFIHNNQIDQTFDIKGPFVSNFF